MLEGASADGYNLSVEPIPSVTRPVNSSSKENAAAGKAAAQAR